MHFKHNAYCRDFDNFLHVNFSFLLFVLDSFVTQKLEDNLENAIFSHPNDVASVLNLLFNDSACILYVAKFMEDYVKRIQIEDRSFIPMKWEFGDLHKFPNSEVAFSYVNLAIYDALLLTKDTN